MPKVVTQLESFEFDDWIAAAALRYEDYVACITFQCSASYVGSDCRPQAMNFFQRIRRTLFSLKPSRPVKQTVLAGGVDVSTLPQLIGKSDPTILEIGCNDGQHTAQFLDLFPDARIYCFEPDARAQAAFRQHIKSDRVQLFDLALGSTDGVVEFHVSGGISPPHLGFDRDGWDLSGSLRKPKNHLSIFPWVTFGETVPVQVRRLDTWAAQQGVDHVDFIWADVQGAEMDLIEGGRQTLEKTTYLYTEYSNKELYEGQASLEQLTQSLPEFEPVQVYAGDVLLRNRNAWFH